ncbi:MAG: PLP-dependent aminotransferase family protein [Spirochaetales bacterium]|nr:PLP-dependent aminotransferase family protein [Spirochaetales bacterium]
MEKTQVEVPENVIDLGLGHPSLSLLPMDMLKASADKIFQAKDPTFLQYGPDEGGGYFRHMLSGWLSEKNRAFIAPESLFITNGISLGLDLVCTCVSRPGDTVIIEEPTYFYVYEIFKNHHLNIVSVPVDREGMVVEKLEHILKEVKPSFIYTIPFFHNPSSVSLSGNRMDQLFSLCRKHDALIVSDEAYQFLNFSPQFPVSLAIRGMGNKILSLGSFSKILAPGLRLGWIHSTPDLIKKIAGTGFVKSGGGLNPFTGRIVGAFMKNGSQDTHLASLKETYRKRAERMLAALKTCLPSDFEYAEPSGGFFVWIRMPEERDARDLLCKCEANGIKFKPGYLFSETGALHNFIRLSFSYYKEDRLSEGIERLAKVL